MAAYYRGSLCIYRAFRPILSNNYAALTIFCKGPTTTNHISCQMCISTTSAESKPNEDTAASQKVEDAIKQNLEDLRAGKFSPKTIKDPGEVKHFRDAEREQSEPAIGTHSLPHPIWSDDEIHSVKVTHKKPERFVDKLAYIAVKAIRTGFDIFSLFNIGSRTEKKWLTRICFLETVAGVPGMVAAMTRHLHSLRRMRRDHGWIHTLLEEAENERMHLMTFMQLKKPSILFRMWVLGAQGVFVTAFSISYLLSPRFCHRFVGYLEEEAVITYSKCIQDMQSGCLQHWRVQRAPDFAITYWKLKPDATMWDVVLAVRADEAHHRVVNHTLGSMNHDDYNPYKPGQ